MLKLPNLVAGWLTHLHATVVGVRDALCVLALVDVLVHGVVATSFDLLLPVGHASAAVLEAEGAKIAPCQAGSQREQSSAHKEEGLLNCKRASLTAASVCAIQRIAAVPVCESHLAARTVHREDVVDNELLRLEDLSD